MVAAAAAWTAILPVLAVVLGFAPGLAAWAEDGASPAIDAAQSAPPFKTPLIFVSQTKACDAKVTLPPEASLDAKVLNRVSADALAWLWDLVDQANQFEAESGKEEWWRPYSGGLVFKPAFVSERVVSLLGAVWQDTGGAHPNSGFLVENIDRKSGEPIEWTDLFPQAASGKAMTPAMFNWVRDAILEQKKQKLGKDFDRKMAADFMADLGKDAPAFTFARAKSPGLAGGLTLHFAPYAVGSYVEGSYTVVVPASVFAVTLAPAWRDAFGGEPLPEIPDEPLNQP